MMGIYDLIGSRRISNRHPRCENITPRYVVVFKSDPRKKFQPSLHLATGFNLAAVK